MGQEERHDQVYADHARLMEGEEIQRAFGELPRAPEDAEERAAFESFMGPAALLPTVHVSTISGRSSVDRAHGDSQNTLLQKTRVQWTDGGN